MSRIRTILFVAAIAGVASAAVSLGFWQLRRLATRRATNAALIAARNLPAVDITRALREQAPLDGRRVTARGSFDPTDTVLLRGRVQFEAPGLQVVTPFVIDGTDSVIWVLRGFIPSPDAVTPPDSIPAPANGEVTLEGLALAVPTTRDSGQLLTRNGVRTWNRLDLSTVRRHRPNSLSVYLLLTGVESGPGRLPVVPPPELSNGPHLSYALQWFGIAIAVVTFGIIVLRRGDRASAPHLAAP